MRKIAKLESQLEELITGTPSPQAATDDTPASISQTLAAGGGTAMDKTIRSLFHQSSSSTKRQPSKQKKRCVAGKYTPVVVPMASKETHAGLPVTKPPTPKPTKLVNPKVAAGTSSQCQPSYSQTKEDITTGSMISGGICIGHTCL